MGAIRRLDATQHVVRVGELWIGAGNDTIVTYGVGSGVVLALYDPEARLGGMLHAMLSASSNTPPESPAKFVDTGAEFLLRELYAKGAVRARLRAVVAGGAEPGGLLQTGTKSLSALKKVLWKHGISSMAMDVGGRGVRVVTLDCAVGRCVATSRDSRVVLLP